MSEFHVNTSRGAYPVIIGNASRAYFIDRLASFVRDSRFAIVSDENVASLYKSPLDKCFQERQYKPEWIIVKAGENSKTIDNVGFIAHKLIEMKFARDDIIVAIGGGVVGDLAGFAASIYLRGVRWIYMPTTLLAQADASIGGKVGIHFDGIKNTLGAFHPPSMVLIDPSFLVTLTNRFFLSGLAEVLKMAILPGGEKFLIWDKNVREKSYKRDIPVLSEVIEDACRLKASIVEMDEFDRAGRIMLNLGHTIAHALESITDFEKYTHGEAVCVGIRFMSELSKLRGDMTESDFNEIRELFSPVEYEIPPLNYEWHDIVDAIGMDKKRKSGSLNWVYPLGIGSVTIKQLDVDELENVWTDFTKNFGRRSASGG